MRKDYRFTCLFTATLLLSLILGSLDGDRLSAASGIGNALNKALQGAGRGR